MYIVFSVKLLAGLLVGGIYKFLNVYLINYHHVYVKSMKHNLLQQVIINELHLPTRESQSRFANNDIEFHAAFYYYNTQHRFYLIVTAYHDFTRINIFYIFPVDNYIFYNRKYTCIYLLQCVLLHIVTYNTPRFTTVLINSKL